MIDSKATVIEVAVHAPAERVWSALTEPAEIRQWFGWEYDGLDDEIQLIFVDRAEPVPPHRIALSDGSELRLVPGGERTLVRAVMPAPADPAAAAEHDAIAEGWRTFFEQLRFLLERRPEGPRRTLYLTATATGAELLAALATAGSTEEWHTSRRQRIVVDPDDRLLAAVAEAPLESGRSSPVSLTVSAYGLDGAALERLQRVWSARWSPLATPDGAE